MHRSLLALAALLPLAATAQQTPADYLRRFDRNGDGRIDASEYVTYLSEGFHRLDRNHDDRLDGDELPPGPRRAARSLVAFQADLRRVFRQLDRNHDGTLDAKELSRPPPG